MAEAWSKEIPAMDGWYWIKYRMHSSTWILPTYVAHVRDAVHVKTARGEIFVAGPKHGGPELKRPGCRPNKTIRFSPLLTHPPIRRKAKRG